ncbi:MAG: phage tail tape measure protein, partial [Shewanella sp.]|nr:phage tail tape measure protein [Shewanella sp.]
FSAGIASSVQAFKTDGPNMAAAISALGAAGTSAGVTFSEQLSILGQLQATMGGSEAATKYSAFLGAAAGAADKLGLSFLDANNMLLSTPKILDVLRSKYGQTLDALEEQEIKAAFGTDEAVDMIKLLYGEVDTLRGNIDSMNTSLAGGMDKTNQMASAILNGPAESFQLMGQRVTNASAAVGKLFAPTLVFAAGVVGGFATGLSDLMEQFPLLSNGIAIGLTALVGFKVASIIARFAYASYSDALLFGRKVLTWLTAAQLKSNLVLAATKARAVAATAATWALAGAQKAMAVGTKLLTVAQWAWNVALSANPIGVVIMAVAGLIAIGALLIKNWDSVTGFFAGLWDSVVGSFSWAWELLKGALAFSPLGLLVQAWGPITGFFGGLWDGIRTVFAGALDFITSTVLAPINALKETLGDLWSSLFGSGEASLKVSGQLDDPAGGVMAAGAGAGVVDVGGGVSAAAAPVSRVTHDYGGITIQAAPGMDEKALAAEVRRQLEERDRQAAQQLRGRLYD